MVVFALAVAGALSVLFAVLGLFQRSLYGSALCLLGVLLQVALFFLAAGAQTLAFLQVLIYAGAIMVLLIMAVLSASPRLPSLWARLALPGWLAGLALALPFFELAAFYRLRPEAGLGGFVPAPGLERAMAGLLFGPYAWMTELIGVLILLAALATVPEREG